MRRDTVLGAKHKQVIVMVVECKSWYAVMAKVSKKTSDLVGALIIEAFKPFGATFRTLTYDNGKELRVHASIDEALGSSVTSPGP